MIQRELDCDPGRQARLAAIAERIHGEMHGKPAPSSPKRGEPETTMLLPTRPRERGPKRGRRRRGEGRYQPRHATPAEASVDSVVPSRKEVISDRGERLRSSCEADKMMGMNTGNVASAICMGCRCGGREWWYVEDLKRQAPRLYERYAALAAARTGGAGD